LGYKLRDGFGYGKKLKPEQKQCIMTFSKGLRQRKAGSGGEIIRSLGSFLSGTLRRIHETQVVKEEGGQGIQQQGKSRGKGKLIFYS